MVLHVFTSFSGGIPLCIPYDLYSGTSLGWTTQGILEGYPGRVLSLVHRWRMGFHPLGRCSKLGLQMLAPAGQGALTGWC